MQFGGVKMNLIQNTAPLKINENETLVSVLQQLSENKSGFLLVVNSSDKVIGTLTDGDIRRYILSKPDLDFHVKASDICNKDFHFATINTSDKVILENIKKYKYCPLINENYLLLGVYSDKSSKIFIGEQEISNEKPCFIIAEVGNNHNGDLKLAKKLVDLAKEAGANCVKFQMRDMQSLYKFRNDVSEDLGTQYVVGLLDKYQLSDEELFEAFDYAKKVQITPLCTPWDNESLRKLQQYGMSAYKVASADLTNTPLLESLIKTQKTLIVSTGMSTEREIREAADLLNSRAANYVMLHCNSSYPAPFSDINLNYIQRLQKLTNGLVGYSGHERDIHVSVAATALGAKIIERHITLDKNMEGNDHKVSLLPTEFRQMINGIRQVEEAIGWSEQKEINQGEVINREILGKSIFVNSNIKKGDAFESSKLTISAPGKGLQPNKLKDVIGRKAKKDYKKGDLLFESDIFETKTGNKNWNFNMKFGIPVRYHDYENLYKNRTFDIVEFHLSYKDLEIEPGDFLNGKSDKELIVHCPELFENDHVLNLVSKDKRYLEETLSNLNKTIEHVNKLKNFFPKTKTPLLITNVGGFSADGFWEDAEKNLAYEKLSTTLGQYKYSGVEIIPQTMPPFPWHFGGQRYHNLFVKNDEIVKFCKENGTRICFDISHSKLASNFYDIDFLEFIDDLSQVTAHLHIVDAAGVSGEGLQIGKGEIDFKTIFPKIENSFSGKSFVPEVWQGHKNNGEGFWEAFNRLS